MATIKIAYSSKTAMTMAIASLATSSTFLGGYESTEVDNTANLYDDVMIEGLITTGTSPTVGTSILVYAWGASVSLATTAKDTLDGTGSAETLTVANPPFLHLIANIIVTATSNVTYNFGLTSLAQVLGNMPPFWGLFITHNTAVNLNSTAGNHAMAYVGITHTVA